MGDIITRPDHYCDGRKYEPKDVIRDWGLNFNLGSAVKYISRAGRKGDKLEDLRKARQFLEFEIKAVEEKEKSDIGMTCKEAAEIGDAMSKGFEEGIKEAEENSDIEIETVNECMISAYVNGLFCRIIEFNSIPDEYKPIIIDKIAQKVLNNQWNIVRDIPTKELQDMVVDWIIELINNDELDRFDIPAGLYKECGRIREAIADKGYCKALDGIKSMRKIQKILSPSISSSK